MATAKKAAKKAAKRSAKKTPAKKASSKRTLIAPKGDKRYVKRDEQGRIKESVEVGRSLSADSRTQAKTVAKPGHGDEGDEVKARKSPARKNS